MPIVKKISYIEAKERQMIGILRETSFQEAGGVWREFYGGACEELNKLPTSLRACDDIDTADGIGFMYDFKDQNHYSLILGDFFRIDVKAPEGFSVKHCPAGLTAQAQIEGDDIADIMQAAYRLITGAIAESGGIIDRDNFYWCEVYTTDRYTNPLREGKKVIIDYIMPIKTRTTAEN